MKTSTREWLDKAESDYDTALRERRARRRPNHDAACFHAQQCIEKYLKACLVETNVPFSKTHDLDRLLDMNLPLQPLWSVFRPLLIELGRYAVAFRYPGESASRDMAKTALANCTTIRKAIRDSLGLTSP